MAKSQYEYVKQFELSDVCLPQTWLMCRIDGVAFTKFTAAHALRKPNDDRARDLMNAAAKAVMTEYTDICIAYGVSDEYSFVLQPQTDLYNRRTSKISSAIVSIFTSAYVANWSNYFPESPLQLNNLPFFDSRLVCYPSDNIMKDYLRWRQVDCHINNLYNCCFWRLVKSKLKENPQWTEKQAREKAHEEMNSKYASSGAKNDLLHDQYGVNYNDEPEADRKGSILVWQEVAATPAPLGNDLTPSLISSSSAPVCSTAAAEPSVPSSPVAESNHNTSASSPATASPGPAQPQLIGAPRAKRSLVILHCDLIQESFYTVTCPGIIPYRSWSDTLKLKKAEEKLQKKQQHKKREQAEREVAAGTRK